MPTADGSTHFDAVLDHDMTVLHNGARADCIAVVKYMYIQGGHDLDKVICVPGDTMRQMTVSEYLIRYDTSRRGCSTQCRLTTSFPRTRDLLARDTPAFTYRSSTTPQKGSRNVAEEDD